MKFLNTLIILLVSIGSIAQIEEPVGNFDTIKVYDLIKVNLVKSDENKIIITGEDASDVEFVQKNGILKIRMRFEKSFDGDQTFVHVHYKELLTIDGNEGSVITSNELIEQEQIELRTQEGATIRAGVKVDVLKIRAVTGGIMEISGTTHHQQITVNTGGIVENENLRSNHTTVIVKAGGEVEVQATESVDVDIKAGGDVIVYGNPKKVRKKTFAGGSIQIN